MSGSSFISLPPCTTEPTARWLQLCTFVRILMTVNQPHPTSRGDVSPVRGVRSRPPPAALCAAAARPLRLGFSIFDRVQSAVVSELAALGQQCAALLQICTPSGRAVNCRAVDEELCAS
jgi:hypothetical protein